MKLSRVLQIAAAAALASGSSAYAADTATGTVGGTVQPINSVTATFTDPASVTIPSAGSDVNIVTGTIDNNSITGWKLTVTSGNLGKLLRTGGGGQIVYTNVAFTGGGGTLGAGLTAPSGAKPVDAVPAIFNTGTAVGTPGTATTATVGYGYTLSITVPAATSRIAGTYTDTITVTVANDS
jgi:hypothetical protein